MNPSGKICPRGHVFNTVSFLTMAVCLFDCPVAGFEINKLQDIDGKS
jgi:hypothetical protein